MLSRDRLSGCCLMTPNWGLTQLLEGWSTAGYGAISLTKTIAMAYPADHLIRRLDETGLRVSALQNFDPFDVLAGVNHGIVNAETLSYLDFAAQVNPDCLFACVGARGSLRFDEALKILSSQIEQLLPYLQERSLRLAIEPLHPLRQDLSFLNDAADAVELVRQFNDPHLGYVYDFWHLWYQREALTLAQTRASDIFCVQVSDHKAVTLRTWDRALPGEGIIALQTFFDALECGGYKGFYDLEVLSDDNDERGYEETIAQAAWRLKSYNFDSVGEKR